MKCVQDLVVSSSESRILVFATERHTIQSTFAYICLQILFQFGQYRSSHYPCLFPPASAALLLVDLINQIRSIIHMCTHHHVLSSPACNKFLLKLFKEKPLDRTLCSTLYKLLASLSFFNTGQLPSSISKLCTK